MASHRCKQLEEKELDGAVLNVLKTHQQCDLRPGQVVKLMHNKNHNYPHALITDFFEESNRVRSSLHRLERMGEAACEQEGRPGRSKRWRFTQKANAKSFSQEPTKGNQVSTNV